MIVRAIARRVIIAVLAASCALPLPAIAADSAADYAAAIRELQRDDARLQTIAWRLARANAPFCADRGSGIGLLLYDARSFARTDAVRTALGVSGDIAVGAVAAGSPAAQAGIEPGAAVLAIDGADMAALPAVKSNDYSRLDALHDRIDQALAERGSVTIKLAGKGFPPRTVTVSGAAVCRSRVELLTAGQNARADGRRVQVGRTALDVVPGDAEAAALVAHELAHNILAHRRRLAAVGRARSAIRITEREADRLAPWLMANAGYDPAAASRYRATWGRRYDPGLFSDGTHDGWRSRLRDTEIEIAAIAEARRSGTAGPLDWRPRFPTGPLR